MSMSRTFVCNREFLVDTPKTRCTYEHQMVAPILVKTTLSCNKKKERKKIVFPTTSYCNATVEINPFIPCHVVEYLAWFGKETSSHSFGALRTCLWCVGSFKLSCVRIFGERWERKAEILCPNLTNNKGVGWHDTYGEFKNPGSEIEASIIWMDLGKCHPSLHHSISHPMNEICMKWMNVVH